MDGRGRCMDNVFIERLWRSLKYEEVYLKAYPTVAEAKAGIGSWVGFYNAERLHQALGYRTPAHVFAGTAGAVDMTLRLRRSLGNAAALATYPQPTTAGFQLR
jgi:putative transposase